MLGGKEIGWCLGFTGRLSGGPKPFSVESGCEPLGKGEPTRLAQPGACAFHDPAVLCAARLAVDPEQAIRSAMRILSCAMPRRMMQVLLGALSSHAQ